MTEHAAAHESPAHLHTTRTFYDTIAADYAEHFRAEPAHPLARAVLGAFAELVRADGGAQVAELGCGPGAVTAHLHGLGLDIFGVDLSPKMVELAREAHPELRFEVGTMTALELPDATLGAVVSWYSLIHTPPEQLPSVLAEFHRVLAPGGRLLAAFQTGEEPLRLERPFGHDVSLDYRRLSPDRTAALLTEAGFTVDARLLREREAAANETAPQAYLLARRAAPAREPAG
ncbi:class I SAM-dependent DNA methyltransferase [Streptomyces sp. NPDC087658]|uniref:class I SAM-dependent DNA methyltransferase n=1 Tax=Streptomyces sp. NPDC087658 TaxID=3365800 RepID=UPI00380920E7